MSNGNKSQKRRTVLKATGVLTTSSLLGSLPAKAKSSEIGKRHFVEIELGLENPPNFASSENDYIPPYVVEQKTGQVQMIDSPLTPAASSGISIAKNSAGVVAVNNKQFHELGATISRQQSRTSIPVSSVTNLLLENLYVPPSVTVQPNDNAIEVTVDGSTHNVPKDEAKSMKAQPREITGRLRNEGEFKTFTSERTGEEVTIRGPGPIQSELVTPTVEVVNHGKISINVVEVNE